MSCYLNLYLKKKNVSVKDFKINLGYLSTTPARDLADNVELEYYGGQPFSETEDERKIRQSAPEYMEYQGYSKMSEDLLKDIIKSYSDNINDMKKQIVKLNDHIKELENLLIRSTTAEVFEHIEEQIASDRESIEYYNESIEEADSYRNFFIWGVQNILEDNADYDRETNTWVNRYEVIYHLG